ncbi:MAG TPA: universal stress protein [Methylomirabilota bacterium]|jgi:nucleotide-binding universal stress UspA family protein|nr:universal stress protein [Methylomirabilota bacterium]
MRVLLATDGSKGALTATEWLREFPLPPDTTLAILTVATLPSPPIVPETLRDLRDAVLADARRIGDEALKLVVPRWPKAEIRVSEGDPREEIVRIAEEWGADLVVVGARGLGAVKGFLLGSVSLAVVRHAPCSVLVVKGEPRRPRAVVLALDGSENSMQALEFLASLDPGKSLGVRLLGVVEKVRFPSSAPGRLRASLRAALAEMEQERRSELEALLGRAKAALETGVGTVEASVVAGPAAEEIIRVANSDGGDLVVVGARGLGAVKRLLLGSVSERVLRDARWPVLIVRRPREGAV